MKKLLMFLLCAILVSGCATTTGRGADIYNFGVIINRTVPAKIDGYGTCELQAKIYKWYFRKVGKDAKVMRNEDHAFVVIEGRIYDSTRMWYTGRSVDDIYVRRYYGEKETWVEIWGNWDPNS